MTSKSITKREPLSRPKQRETAPSPYYVALKARPKSPAADDRVVDSKPQGAQNKVLAARRPSAVNINDPLALIRKHDLARLLGVNSWTIDNWRRAGSIPPPVVLSPQIVAWRRSDIERWLIERQQSAEQRRT
jgi:predicted DNA-binding transcriptional regulator AlpA